MLEQFTKNAMKAHMFALDEAARLGYRTVGPEHLLLGLIREGSGSASYVLEDEGVTLAACRRNIEAIADGSNQLSELGRPWYKQLFALHRTEEIERPFSEEAKTALSLSSGLAKECHRNVVDTGELLVGILDVPNSKVVEILRRCGADPAKIRERIGLFFLSLLTAKSTARAATRRAFKVERRSAENT